MLRSTVFFASWFMVAAWGEGVRRRPERPSSARAPWGARYRMRTACSSLATIGIACVIVLGCSPSSGHTAMPHISLAVVNARAWTGDTSRPWADAIAVSGDRIVAVGASAQIRKMADSATRIIDAKGAMLVPGFIDSHVHFLDGGFGLSSVQLRDAATPAEFIARIKAFAASAPPGTW